jgi:hypothetical protein
MTRFAFSRVPAVVSAGLLVNALVVGVCVAQGAPSPRGDGAMRGRPMQMGHRRRGGGRDQVAMLLDKQLALQLTGQQVNQLIAIHQQERQEAKPLMARMMALMPKGREGFRNMTAVQRDSLGAIHESLQEIQWRQVSAAAAVLNDDQKKIAARLTARPQFGRGPMGFGRGPMGGRDGRDGRGGMRADSTSKH